MKLPNSLFRYRPFQSEHDFRTLQQSYLWASNFDRLNDPMEAFLRFNSSQDLLELNQMANSSDFLAGAQRIISDIAPSLAVVCFSTGFEFRMMWGYYANSFKGACLEYNTSELILSSRNGAYHPKKVNYSDVPTKDFAFSTDSEIAGWHENYKSRLFLKHSDWQHEEEWRIVCGQSGELPILKSALKNVYCGPLMQKEKISRICELLKTEKTSVFAIELVGYDLKPVQIK